MIERRTLSDQVYQHLLREIMSGRLSPGHALNEASLATQLGVSRSAVREALWRLTSQSVVECRGKQTLVRSFGPVEISNVFQIREALEGMAIELACGQLAPDDFDRFERLLADVPPRGAPHHQEACHRLDLELHGVVAQRCGNPVLKREIDRLNDLVDIVRFRVGEGHGALEAALRSHLRIIDALREGNAAAARQRMVEHIRESGEAAARWALADECSNSENELAPAS